MAAKLRLGGPETMVPEVPEVVFKKELGIFRKTRKKKRELSREAKTMVSPS